mgnify:CR=1 FL=1
MTRPGLGLLPPDGRHDAAMSRLMKPMCAATDAEIPDEVDPGEILTVNDQGPFNSCCGNATDKALEWDRWLTTGKRENLSARFSYCAARMIDGTNDGPDAGAQIEAGARGSSEIGFVTEADLPYWDYQNGEGFDPEIHPDMLKLAQQNKAQSIVRMRSMDECFRFIGTNQGGIIYGIWWTQELQNYDGSFMIQQSFGSSVVGGHALCLPGYKTIDGEKCPETWNSHSVRWGSKGRMVTRPNVLWKAIEAAPWGAYGISCGKSFTKKPFQGFHGVF